MDEANDVVIIGSGIGGLSCAALLAHYGFAVTVCESHTIPGGAAHAFERNGFKFDSGPSLYSGLSYSPSANPLRQVLDAIGEDLQWVNYDTWGCCLPEGDFDTSVGADQFCQVLAQYRGDQAVAEWQALQRRMEPAETGCDRTAIRRRPLRFRRRLHHGPIRSRFSASRRQRDEANRPLHPSDGQRDYGSLYPQLVGPNLLSSGRTARRWRHRRRDGVYVCRLVSPQRGAGIIQ